MSPWHEVMVAGFLNEVHTKCLGISIMVADLATCKLGDVAGGWVVVIRLMLWQVAGLLLG